MKERAVMFGPGNSIHGIVSEPHESIFVEEMQKRCPFVLILNSGLLHKVGPYRLTVDLARSICEMGFFVLRFDLRGIGDSQLAPSNESFHARAVKDVLIAMDFIAQNYQINRFVVGGLCSGADVSFYTASQEERVVGIFNLDGYGFRNRYYYAYYYGQRLLSKRFINEKINRIFTYKWKDDAPFQEAATRDRLFPTLEQAASHFARIVLNRAKMLYIYTLGVQSYNTYKNQLRDSFAEIDFGDLLETEIYPFAEHTYPRVDSRKVVVERIQQWMKQHFYKI